MLRWVIEAECRRLVESFALHIDSRNNDGIIAMFTPDAHYEPIGDVLDGHAAIRRYLDARPPDRLTLHVMSNIVIDVAGETRAMGGSYVSYVNARAGDAAHDDGGVPFDGITLIGRYEDRFERAGDGWRFSQRLCRAIVRRAWEKR